VKICGYPWMTHNPWLFCGWHPDPSVGIIHGCSSGYSPSMVVPTQILKQLVNLCHNLSATKIGHFFQCQWLGEWLRRPECQKYCAEIQNNIGINVGTVCGHNNHKHHMTLQCCLQPHSVIWRDIGQIRCHSVQGHWLSDLMGQSTSPHCSHVLTNLIQYYLNCVKHEYLSNNWTCEAFHPNS
jgi:hypothetical protein